VRLIRVFPRKTKATPDDELAYFGPPDLFAQADEVHVSVAFTYDKAKAEALAEAWRYVAPVKVGGVAYGDPGQDFIPGRYIKPGYVFTSRGCPAVLVLLGLEARSGSAAPPHYRRLEYSRRQSARLPAAPCGSGFSNARSAKRPGRVHRRLGGVGA
jgi:hypothetical protein